MKKVLMGPTTLVLPTPAFLIGADVDGKPNFMAVAWSGIVNSDPPMISVAIRPARHTRRGIIQNSTFSVNIPSADLTRETDYCGIRSGSKVDKVAVCQFKVFYGKLGTAPLIEQCPVNLECRVVHTMELGSHTLFIGQVEETHLSANCLTDGKPDIDKISPIIYAPEPFRQYLAFGQVTGKGFQAGLELEGKK
jgi:flavin reductase (DIM6/NTAB) family NADH-FMN oxidoreductase RutF